MNKPASVVFETISTGGFAVHITPAPYAALHESRHVTTVRRGKGAIRKGQAKSGHRSLSHPSHVGLARTGAHGLREEPWPCASTTVVANFEFAGSRWAQ